MVARSLCDGDDGRLSKADLQWKERWESEGMNTEVKAQVMQLAAPEKLSLHRSKADLARDNTEGEDAGFILIY